MYGEYREPVAQANLPLDRTADEQDRSNRTVAACPRQLSTHVKRLRWESTHGSCIP